MRGWPAPNKRASGRCCSHVAWAAALLQARNKASVSHVKETITVHNGGLQVPDPGRLGGMQARRGLTGVMNYTNPGAISHNEILELYRCYVDPEFKWANFSVEEQAKVIVAPRSNNLLDTARVGRRQHLMAPTCWFVTA